MMQRVEIKLLLSVIAAFLAAALTTGGGECQSLVQEDYGIQVDVASVWTYTDIFLFEGDTVFVLAKGTISSSGPGSDGWQDWYGPEGAAPSQPGGCTECPLPGLRTGALIARIGTGPAFHVGSFSAFVCDTSGVLQFGVNEDQVSDNRGHLLAFVWRESGPNTPTDAEEEQMLPGHYSMSTNYPNPFNPSTSMKFMVPKKGHVKIAVYDVAGRKIKMLADGEYDRGEFTATWDGKNENGMPVASGVYFARMESTGYSTVTKMVLLR